MEGPTESIVHSPKCYDPKTPTRKRCSDCYRTYKNENQTLNRQKKKDSIKQTRNAVAKRTTQWGIAKDQVSVNGVLL